MPVFRDQRQNIVYQITVRINNGHAFAVFNIAYGHIFYERRFSGSGLTNSINMPAPVIFLHINKFFFLSKNTFAYQNSFFGQIRRRSHFSEFKPFDPGNFGCRCRQMKKTDQLISSQSHSLAIIKFSKNIFINKIALIARFIKLEFIS